MTISLVTTLEQVRTEHHTEKYKTDGLVVRRGFPVHFETAETSLTIKLVPAHPDNGADFGFEFTTSVEEPFQDWTLETSDEGNLTLHIPPTAPVGMYAVTDGDEKVAMAVLFNPFCEDDETYMEGDDERNEYVLNDVGRIWVGSHTSSSGIPWTFAQFRSVVMLVSLSLLDSMSVEERGDPVKVTRHLSAAVNVQDDNGVLVGRWDGKYDDGTSPSAWTGSFEILNQYWSTLRPVSYGQCWVFSGVFTSVMRSLGLAARSITNFVSAHDTTKPYNRAVDKYYDSDGDLIERMSSDSIWNFHVWNEAFMKRPDLQAESEEHGLDYNGWQILDATPQEESAGLYQLGPAPLTAIKHGYAIPMDVDFVIGEVNADVVHYWQVEDSDEFQVRKKYSQHVGQKISTKAVGLDKREDVTLDYKFEEGTEEERASLAGRPSGEVEPEPQPSEDVKFEVETLPDVKVGESIRFVIKGTNTSDEAVRIRFKCLYRATDYTGGRRGRLGRDKERVRVEPGEVGEMVVEISAEEYEPYLAKGVQTIEFTSSAKVHGTGQVWSFVTLVRLNADEALHVDAPDTVELGQAQTVTAVVTNIAHVALTNVKLRAEGEGLLDHIIVDLDTIEPGDTVETELTIEPSEIGDRLLVTTLDTDELKDISRSAHIVVEDSSGQGQAVQDVWQGQQSQNIADMVNIQSREG